MSDKSRTMLALAMGNAVAGERVALVAADASEAYAAALALVEQCGLPCERQPGRISFPGGGCLEFPGPPRERTPAWVLP